MIVIIGIFVIATITVFGAINMIRQINNIKDEEN